MGWTANWSSELKDGWNRENFSITDVRRNMRSNYAIRPFPRPPRASRATSRQAPPELTCLRQPVCWLSAACLRPWVELSLRICTMHGLTRCACLACHQVQGRMRDDIAAFQGLRPILQAFHLYHATSDAD